VSDLRSGQDSGFAPPPHDSADLELLIEHHLQRVIARGTPPSNLRAWRAAVRDKEFQNERDHQGWIAQAAAGLREAAAASTGKPLTGWRETRGSHGIDYVYDPAGTDRPPADEPWDRDKAKAEWQARRPPRHLSSAS
jgi:hypothetical protein